MFIVCQVKSSELKTAQDIQDEGESRCFDIYKNVIVFGSPN